MQNKKKRTATCMMPALPHTRVGFRRSNNERGVVLVITLILIVILSLLGTFAIRNATQSERSINGIRTSQVAQEAAETALRFCEQIVLFADAGKDYTEYGTTGHVGKIFSATITSEQDTNAAWRTADNWVGNNVIEVPPQYFKRYVNSAVADDASPLRTAPRCLIQKIESDTTPKFMGYLITARGFANNANFNASTGKTNNGAEVWVQSILTKT